MYEELSEARKAEKEARRAARKAREAKLKVRIRGELTMVVHSACSIPSQFDCFAFLPCTPTYLRIPRPYISSDSLDLFLYHVRIDPKSIEDEEAAARAAEESKVSPNSTKKNRKLPSKLPRFSFGGKGS